MAKRSNPAMKIAQETAHSAMFDAAGQPRPGLHKVLLRAVEVQRPLVLANIRRLQRRHPHATAAQLAAILERDYLLAVTGGGALVGGAAVIPGVGTAAALGLSAAAAVGFLEATALYSTALAELHGIRMVDPDRASTLVMAVMLGEEGTQLLSSLSGQAAGRGKGPTQAWTAAFTRRVPLAGFGTVRAKMQTMFLRSLLKTQGTAWLGRALPFGIGAVVGGVGNRVMGHAVVANAKEAFGPIPDTIPGELQALAETTGPAALYETSLDAQPDGGAQGRRTAAPRTAAARTAAPGAAALRRLQRRTAARFGSEH